MERSAAVFFQRFFRDIMMLRQCGNCRLQILLLVNVDKWCQTSVWCV